MVTTKAVILLHLLVEQKKRKGTKSKKVVSYLADRPAEKNKLHG
jgi:hypothetical protein